MQLSELERKHTEELLVKFEKAEIELMEQYTKIVTGKLTCIELLKDGGEELKKKVKADFSESTNNE